MLTRFHGGDLVYVTVQIGLWVTVEIGFTIGFLGFSWCFVAVGCCGGAGWGWVCCGGAVVVCNGNTK